MAHALDFEKLAIGLVPELAQVGEVGDPLVDVEVLRLLMVVSVRRARCSLKYCFTCECLYSTWRLGCTPSVITRVR